MGAHHRVRRYAPYTTQVRNQMSTFLEKDQKAFKAWVQEYIKDSNHKDLHDDIPSSQIPPKASHINSHQAQLFAVIDTCSLVRYRSEFMKFITELRRSYDEKACPVKFIMPLVVLEELDKCNRPIKKRGSEQQQISKQNHNQQQQLKQQPLTTNIKAEPIKSINVEKEREVPISDLLQKDAPPRSFMRFIDHEMRAGLIVGDLDPYKTQKLPPIEIINHDDRILESSLRAKMFVAAHPHHIDTRVVLVTEDNNFKSKATTFEVASFRWREFEAKYHNFGRKHCVSTPLINKLDITTKENQRQQLSGTKVQNQSERIVPPWTTYPANESKYSETKESNTSIKVLPREVSSTCGLDDKFRRTTLKIKSVRSEREDEIAIIREVISLL